MKDEDVYEIVHEDSAEEPVSLVFCLSKRANLASLTERSLNVTHGLDPLDLLVLSQLTGAFSCLK